MEYASQLHSRLDRWLTRTITSLSQINSLVNENARVIITFIETADSMQTLLNAVSSKTEIGTFIWLGADGLDLFDEQPVAGSDMLEGAMYVEHPFYTMPDFEDFLKTVTPANSLDNR